MADYDLGTAHGRIVIETDNRGSGNASASLRELEAAAASLNKAFASTERAMGSFNSSISQTQRSVSDVDNSVRRMSTTISGVTGAISSATGSVRSFGSELQNLASQAIQAGQKVDDLQGTFERFSSIGGFLKGAISSFADLDGRMSQLPRWQQHILALNRAFSGMAAAAPLVASLGTRIGGLVASTAAFGVVSSRLHVFGTGLRNALAFGALLSPRFASMGTAVRGFGTRLGVAGVDMERFSGGVVRATRGFTQLITGALLVGRSFQGIAQAAKLAVVGMSGITAAVGALKVVGTVALGLVNSITQLAGTFAILPGVIATVGIAGGVAKLAMAGMKEAFKAAGKDGADFDKAIKDLSPTLQGVAKAAHSVKPELDKLKDIATSNMFAGFADDIKNLGGTYFPLLDRGVAEVARALNSGKNAVRDFLIEPQTIKDVSTAFDLTGVSVQNIARGIRPLLNGLRDFAIVGMQSVNQLTGGFSLLTNRFQNFAAGARADGSIKRWIDQGIQGFRDLGGSLVSIGSAFKSIFQAFGVSGDNALARLKKGADSFRDSMAKSASDGSLKAIAGALSRMSDTGLKAVEAAIKAIAGAIERAAPFFEKMQTAFSGGLISGIQLIGSAANILASALGHLSGLGGIVGQVLAFGVAIKGLAFVFGPVTRAITLFAGAFTLLRGATNVMGGLNTAMATMGVRSTVAAVGMNALRGAGSAVLSFFGGPIGAAIAAAAAALLLFKSGIDNTNKAQQQLATNSKHAQDAVTALTQAFQEANGVMGKGVFDTVTQQLGVLRQDLDDTAKTNTGFSGTFSSWAKDAFSLTGIMDTLSGSVKNNATANQEENTRLDRSADAAKAAARAFDNLKLSNSDLAKAISGSQGDWDSMKQRFAALGDDGQQAINKLQPFRNTFVEIQASMAAIGPTSLALTNSFQTLADASSTASEKLGAIRSALQALGILESDATSTAFQLTQTIKDIGDSTSQALGPTEQLGNALKNNTGGFNTTNATAKLLHDELKKLGDALIDTAATGGDVNGAYAQMQGTLNALAQQADLSRGDIDALGKTVGIAPKELTILVSLQGNTEAQQEVKNLLLQVAQVKGQTFDLTIQAKTTEAQAAIKQIFGDAALINATTGQVHVTGDTAAARVALDQILTQANSLGVTPAKVNVTAPALPGILGQLQGIGVAAGSIPPGQVNVTAPGVPGILQQLGIVKQATNIPPTQIQITAPNIPGMQVALAGIAAATKLPPIKIDVQAPDVAPTQAAVQGLQQTLQGIQSPPPLTLQLNGVQDAQGAITNFDGAVNASAGNFAKFAEGVTAAIGGIVQAAQSMSQQVVQALQGAASGAQASGAALGQGFADGIRSKVSEVAAAAAALAEAAAAPLPRSPAKIGPFSGQGWTLFRGRSLTLGFAEGILSGTGNAKDAALTLSELVSNALDSVRSVLGQPITSFGANRAPGPSGATFFRDPTVTDADLAAARQKKAADAAQATADQTFRDTKKANTDTATGKPADTGKVDEFVKSLDNAQFAMGGFNQAMLDCSGFVSAVANEATGRAAFSERASTANMREFLKNRGFKEGVGGPGDLRVGWFNDPNAPGGGHTALTTGSGLNAESTDGGVRFGKGAAGALDKQFTDHMFLPMSKAQDPTTKAIQENTDVQKKGSADLNQNQQQIVDQIVAAGISQGASQDEINAAIATGIVESNLTNVPGGPDSSAGVFQQQNFAPWTSNGRDRMNVTDAATTFFEQIKKTDPNLNAGDRAQAVQKSAFPAKYGQQLDRAAALQQQSLDRQGQTVSSLGDLNSTGTQTLSAQEQALTELRGQNKQLDQSIKIAQDPTSTDAQVILALQDIADGIAVTQDPDAKEGLKAVQDAVEQDRGIKQFDPTQDASKDPVGDTFKVIQGVFNLIDQVKQGLDQLTAVGDILVRGISNTEDINKLVDGIQGFASTVGSVVSTVSEIITTVAQLAALATIAIPGIGQVAAAASAISGGIGSVNAIIDTIQQGFQIGGWIVGTIVSALAGGAAGPLSGDVHILLDKNDNTVKTWSTNDPTDKRIHPLGPNTTSTTNNNAPQNLAIYAGPGTDPYQMMNEAMFAIRATQQGVY